MKPITERVYSDEPEYDQLTFEYGSPTSYKQLPQLRGEALRSGRIIVVNDHVYLEPYPRAGHESFVERVIEPEEGDIEEADPHYLLIRIASSGLTVQRPDSTEVNSIDVHRFGMILDALGVPPNEEVHWAMGLVAETATAGDYYDLTR